MLQLVSLPWSLKIIIIHHGLGPLTCSVSTGPTNISCAGSYWFILVQQFWKLITIYSVKIILPVTTKFGHSIIKGKNVQLVLNRIIYHLISPRIISDTSKKSHFGCLSFAKFENKELNILCLVLQGELHGFLLCLDQSSA